MVQVTIDREQTPDLIPVPPEWMQRQNAQNAPNQNRNINDIFWQKGPNEADPGWIIVGPSALKGADGHLITRQAESWIRRGRTPLIEYSYTDRRSPRTGLPETIETSTDRLGTTDRYYWFFRNGGAPLFPIEQIVAHHWHITPPFGLARSVFPQLDEWDVPDPYYCPACAGNKPPKNSVEEVIQHLMIEHRQTLIQARDLQKSTNSFREKPAGNSGLSIRRKVAKQEGSNEPSEIERLNTEGVPDVATPKLIICDQCGEQFKDGLAKARHIKNAHSA